MGHTARWCRLPAQERPLGTRPASPGSQTHVLQNREKTAFSYVSRLVKLIQLRKRNNVKFINEFGKNDSFVTSVSRR